MASACLARTLPRSGGVYTSGRVLGMRLNVRSRTERPCPACFEPLIQNETCSPARVHDDEKPSDPLDALVHSQELARGGRRRQCGSTGALPGRVRHIVAPQPRSWSECR